MPDAPNLLDQSVIVTDEIVPKTAPSQRRRSRRKRSEGQEQGSKDGQPTHQHHPTTTAIQNAFRARQSDWNVSSLPSTPDFGRRFDQAGQAEIPERPDSLMELQN